MCIYEKFHGIRGKNWFSGKQSVLLARIRSYNLLLYSFSVPQISFSAYLLKCFVYKLFSNLLPSIASLFWLQQSQMFLSTALFLRSSRNSVWGIPSKRIMLITSKTMTCSLRILIHWYSDAIRNMFIRYSLDVVRSAMKICSLCF